MQHYTADVEVARRGDPTDAQTDMAMDYLADYAAAIGVTPRGHQTARITFPADSIGQAARMAALVVEHALASTVIRVDVMPEAEADDRDGEQPVPELVDVTYAAWRLDVSPQRIRQMISEGKIGAHRIGERTLVLVKSEVDARANAA